MTVVEVRRAVWQRLGMWLTPQQVRAWARKRQGEVANKSGAAWSVDCEAIIDAVRFGEIRSVATSREGALLRAVSEAGRRVGAEPTLEVSRAHALLTLADGAPRKMRRAKEGRSLNGAAASLGANIKVECGVTLDRRILASFFDVL